MKLLLTLLLPVVVQASEVDVACNLERSKAELAAALLTAPQALLTFGQDSATGEKNALVGISQSLIGKSRATTIRRAADAKCEALSATIQLDQQSRFAIAQIGQTAARAELVLLMDTLRMSNEHVSLFQRQLDARSITIAQYTDAVQTRSMLEARLTALERQLAAPVPTAPDVNISTLISRAQLKEAQAASLVAKSSADAGWDVVVAGGMRQSFAGGSTPFVGVTIKYSFGLEASRQAAHNVGKYTGQLLAEQQGGYYQTSKRQYVEVQNLMEVERSQVQTSRSTLSQLQHLRQPLSGLDTVLAQNMIRTLDIQIKLLEGSIVGAESRAHGYQSLLEQMK